MKSLVSAAIPGTGQLPSFQVTTGQPIDALLEQLDPTHLEKQLLLAAGALSIYRRVGYVPAELPGPEEAPLEEDTPGSARLASLLPEILVDSAQALLIEALEQMKAKHILLPPELLPQFMDLGSRKKELRSRLYAVLGRRGHWLSSHNSTWAWVAEYRRAQAAQSSQESQQVWAEGTQEQRVASLQAVRTLEPGTARAWLMTSWKQENATARKQFLATFIQGLSAEDEAFLESVLSDRSPEIRHMAAELLSQIPCSAFNQRMRTRAATLLTYQDGGFRVQVPESLDANWKHDGFAEESPLELLEAQGWLKQLAEQLPLTFWEEHFACTPDQLSAVQVDSSRNQIILAGWCNTLRRFPAQGWPLALWQWWLQAEEQKVLKTSDARTIRLLLLTQVNQREAEALVAESIEHETDWADFFRALPRPWSETFSNYVLARLSEQVKKPDPPIAYQNNWYITLLETTNALAPETLSQALELSNVRPSKQPQWERHLQTFRHSLKTRQQLLKEIKR